MRVSAHAPGQSDDEQPTTYRFGPYILDARRRVLLIDSNARPLSEKVFQLLLLLLRARGAVVQRDDFFNQLWPREDTSDANLAQHIFLLRGALGEPDRHRSIIVTVPGVGYRLGAAVESKLGLSMKGSCEACETPLSADAEAFICSYECTFCPDCARDMNFRCQNCGGEQVVRPRRG